MGDGWYVDGFFFVFDYYSSYVFYFMYLEMLQGMKDVGKYICIYYKKYYDCVLKCVRKFSFVLECLIFFEGIFLVFGCFIFYCLVIM